MAEANPARDFSRRNSRVAAALRLGEERGEPPGAGRPWVLEGSAGL
jgi:hypothetical protein